MKNKTFVLNAGEKITVGVRTKKIGTTTAYYGYITIYGGGWRLYSVSCETNRLKKLDARLDAELIGREMYQEAITNTLHP